MTALAQKVKDTPMAPYMDIMQSMSQQQKLVVMAFLVDSMQGPNMEEEKPKRMLKPNPFKHYQAVSEFSDVERSQLMKRIRETAVSPETESLINGLSLSAEEMKDERTRYILGLEQ